jgi:NAD(P)-dependent dehydrogenase (short-subunit alcohol dehydrogenase family)
MSEPTATSPGERAVVISGASTGIGRSCALHLDRLGFQVFAGVRRAADGAALARVASPRLTPIVVDITDPEAVGAAYQAVSDRNIALTGLVNNAGSTVPCPLEFLPLETLREQLEVNLVGHVAMIQAFLPLLRRSHGRIVNVSSLAGRLPVPVMGSYTAAKHALEGLSGSLRLELAASGVRVSVVEPGDIQTSMTGKLRRDVSAAMSALPDDGVERYSALMRGVEVAIGAGADSGAPPEVVAEAIAHALTSNRPRIRYQVGPRSGRMMLMARVLPDRLLDRVLQRTFTSRSRTSSSVASHPGSGSPQAPVSTAGRQATREADAQAIPASATGAWTDHHHKKGNLR